METYTKKKEQKKKQTVLFIEIFRLKTVNWILNWQKIQNKNKKKKPPRKNIADADSPLKPF